MTIAIIGPGNMGSGIARLLASTGIDVAFGHRDPAIAGQGDLVAPAKSRAMDRRDDRLGAGFDRGNHRRHLRIGEGSGEFAQVGAGDEGGTRADQDARRQRGIAGKSVDRVEDALAYGE